MQIKKRESTAQQQQQDPLYDLQLHSNTDDGAGAGNAKNEDGHEEQKAAADRPEIQYTGYYDKALIKSLDQDMVDQIKNKKRKLVNSGSGFGQYDTEKRARYSSGKRAAKVFRPDDPTDIVKYVAFYNRYVVTKAEIDQEALADLQLVELENGNWEMVGEKIELRDKFSLKIHGERSLQHRDQMLFLVEQMLFAVMRPLYDH